MRPHAPNQFNERCCARWSGVEGDGAERNFWRRGDNEFRERRFDGDKIDNRARGIFYQTRRKRSQDFTARLISRIFLFGRLGWMRMIRTVALCDFLLRNSKSKRAVIRNGDPRANGNCHRHASHACVHDCLNRRYAANPQMFSFGSMMGAIGPEGMLSGGTTSGRGGIDVDLGAAGASCLIRVDINMAAKSKAAAK